jgi:hypothetical protein
MNSHDFQGMRPATEYKWTYLKVNAIGQTMPVRYAIGRTGPEDNVRSAPVRAACPIVTFTHQNRGVLRVPFGLSTDHHRRRAPCRYNWAKWQGNGHVDRRS